MQYEYAMGRLHDNDYTAARVELQRFVHFFPSDNRIGPARLYLGVCYYHLKEWERAVTEFQRLMELPIGSALEMNAVVMLAHTRLAQGREQDAVLVLRQHLTLADEPAVRDRFLSFLARISLAGADRRGPAALKAARQHLNELSSEGQQRWHTKEVAAVMDRIEANTYKSPGTAGVASALLPGSGFAYCGRYRDALAALVINGGLILAGRDAFQNGQTFLGILLAVIEAGFYSGGIYGSISAAHKFNRRAVRSELKSLPPLDPGVFPGGVMGPSDAGLSTRHQTGVGFQIHIPF